MSLTIDFKPSLKQNQIFKIFDDNETTEVVYGGSVGSGKSYMLASILVMKCLQFPGIRVGLARNTLTNLKKTTMISIMEVFQKWGLTSDYFNYNSSTGIITFSNSSEIVLVELTYIPSDPQFTRLGGMLFTFGVIDEATEVDERGKSIFQTRLGRWMNDETGIKGMLIMTCNPDRSSFIYREFYKPWKQGELKPHQKFIQALPTDNNYLPAGYIENLKNTLSLSERRRLLNGEWELSDTPGQLFKSMDVNLLWDKSIDVPDGVFRMSCDIAFTSDKCIILIWNGLKIIDIINVDSSEGSVHTKMKELAERWSIKSTDICWDADGVGKYLKGEFPNGREIHNNGKPINEEGYSNLKAELYFKLAEFVEAGKVRVIAEGWRKEIDEELSVIKHKPKASMNKIELISKSEMKKMLGRSPDIADAMAYGMVFYLKSTTMTASDVMFVNF